MSFPKDDRKVRSKSGNGFPIDPIAEIRTSLSADVADALRREFGDGPVQIKRIAKLMGVNPRTIRNWLQSDNGPNGAGLVVLMRHSEAVTAAVLALADRRETARGVRESGLKQQLRLSLRALLVSVRSDACCWRGAAARGGRLSECPFALRKESADGAHGGHHAG